MSNVILISSSPLGSPAKAKFATLQYITDDSDFDFDTYDPSSYQKELDIPEELKQHDVAVSATTYAATKPTSLGNLSIDGRSTKRRRLTPPIRLSNGGQCRLPEVEDLSSDFENDVEVVKRASTMRVDKTAADSGDDLPEVSFLTKSVPLRCQRAQKDTTNAVVELSSESSVLLDECLPRIVSMDNAQVKATSRRTSSGSKDSQPISNSSGSTFATFKRTKPGFSTKSKAEEEDPIIDSSQPAPRHSNVKTSADKADDKERQKEAKRADKEREKEQKRRDKQLAADIAEVNKRKTDRKVTACEMTINIPGSLQGKAVGNQVKLSLEEAGAQTKFYEETVDMTDNSAKQLLGKVIRWERSIKSEWHDASDEWKLLPQAKTITEPHILVYMTGQEYCSIAAGGPCGSGKAIDQSQDIEQRLLENFDTYIATIRSTNPNASLVLLVEGLTSFIKKISNSKNREYQESVRQQLVDDDLSIHDPPTQSSTTTRTSKKRKSAASTIDVSFFTDDLVETIDVHLQLEHQPIQIHHTTSVANSAKQIDAFTQHLSTRPYRNRELEHNMKHASFSMATGQVKTGQGDKKETWIKMLEQVNRITVCLAHGVYNAGYESPMELVNGFKALEDDSRQGREGAKLMLEDVKKAANRFGADSDKRLGPMVSKRLYKVFMSTDENLRDGIA